MAGLLALATRKLKLEVPAERIFSAAGDEYDDDDDLQLIAADEVLYVSCGEVFSPFSASAAAAPSPLVATPNVAEPGPVAEPATPVADPSTQAAGEEGRPREPVLMEDSVAAAATPKNGAASLTDAATEDLQNAAEIGDHEAILKALAEGADVDAPDRMSYAPLHWAARCGRPEDVSVLLEAGAKVNATTQNGTTPLICAAMEGWDDAVMVLLSGGAEASLQTRRGRTALDVTRERLAEGVDGADEKRRYEKVLALLKIERHGTGVEAKMPEAVKALKISSSAASAAAAAIGGMTAEEQRQAEVEGAAIAAVAAAMDEVDSREDDRVQMSCALALYCICDGSHPNCVGVYETFMARLAAGRAAHESEGTLWLEPWSLNCVKVPIGLSYLTCDAACRNKARGVNASNIDALILAMRTHLGLPTMQWIGCILLANLTGGGDAGHGASPDGDIARCEPRRCALNSDALQSVACAMRAHPANSRVQQSAVYALYALCSGEGDATRAAQTKARELGFVSLLEQALHTHSIQHVMHGSALGKISINWCGLRASRSHTTSGRLRRLCSRLLVMCTPAYTQTRHYRVTSPQVQAVPNRAECLGDQRSNLARAVPACCGHLGSRAVKAVLRPFPRACRQVFAAGLCAICPGTNRVAWLLKAMGHEMCVTPPSKYANGGRNWGLWQPCGSLPAALCQKSVYTYSKRPGRSLSCVGRRSHVSSIIHGVGDKGPNWRRSHSQSASPAFTSPILLVRTSPSFRSASLTPISLPPCAVD